MSLDDLITLALVALFVGLPLLQRLMGSRGAKPPEEGAEGAEGAGDVSGAPEGRRGSRRSAEREATRQEAESGHGSARAQRTDDSGGASELDRRLEEARKRVQQARQGQGSAGRTDDRFPQVRTEAPSRPLVKPREIPQETQSSGFLGREGVSGPRKKTPPLQVSKRAGARRRSKMPETRVVSLKPKDIMRGIVWHQILSEPVSARTRKRRRKSSRDR